MAAAAAAAAAAAVAAVVVAATAAGAAAAVGADKNVPRRPFVPTATKWWQYRLAHVR